MKEIITVTVIFVAVVGGFALSTNAWEKSQKRTACAVFSAESGRETKYVEYTFWRVDCLTPQENGKWISAFNLRGE